MLETLVQVTVLVFVLGTRGSMGLGLSIAEIAQPLRNGRRVAIALGLSFVAAPACALVIGALLGLDETLAVGLILISVAAGAPFIPKLAQMARVDVAESVALTVLLMVATIFYVPLVLPFILSGVVVDAFAIAQSLVLLMLLPLALGLLIRRRYGAATDGLKDALAQASNLALIALLVFTVVFNFRGMTNLIGSRGLLAGLVFIVAMIGAGYLVGGVGVALATAQRNISAAVLIGGQNFGVEVVTYIMVVSLLSLAILLPLAGELGRRVDRRSDL